MSHLRDKVFLAIHELDAALQAHVHEEAQHNVPREVTMETVLREMRPGLVQALLDHMPTLAHPWRIVDMKRGKATKLVRDGYGEPIAMVRRVAVKPEERWSARVGDAWVEQDDGANWPSRSEAQQACDARLREDGVVIVEVP